MNKKEKFIIARAVAQAFYNGRQSSEVQTALNQIKADLRNDLEGADPKFDGEEFIQLINTATAHAIQHGNAGGRLSSIQTGGKTFP